MRAVDRDTEKFLYRQVTDLISEQMQAGALRPGDRLPSLRRLSSSLGLSIPTVKQAYQELERQGRVESRPQSGFYVRARVDNPIVRSGVGSHRGAVKPSPVRCRSLMERVYDDIHRPDAQLFGIANPSMVRPAAKGLNRAMKRVMARAEGSALGYARSTGDPELVRQIAYRYLDRGGKVEPEAIVVTNGGQEALTIALMAVAEPGDIIAVESPTYCGLLELIESLGMLAVEIETCPQHGLSIPALAKALNRHDIKACIFASCINNPLGSATSDAHRETLVGLLEDRDIPLIEDDVYGELMFDGHRPRLAQFYSRKNLVLTCGSFSKTAAPGYRIGWLLPGRFDEQVRRLKRAFSCSSGLLQQLTLSEYIASGDYDRHLKTIRPLLRSNAERMTALIGRYFPARTRISRPAGGSVLWLELSEHIDSAELFDRALEQSITVCPGSIFSPTGRYRHFVRLSFGFPWDDAVEAGIRSLGLLVARLSGE
jgi:DNA-binding transcriptional MocR family regulator